MRRDDPIALVTTKVIVWGYCLTSERSLTSSCCGRVVASSSRPSPWNVNCHPIDEVSGGKPSISYPPLHSPPGFVWPTSINPPKTPSPRPHTISPTAAPETCTRAPALKDPNPAPSNRTASEKPTFDRAFRPEHAKTTSQRLARAKHSAIRSRSTRPRPRRNGNRLPVPRKRRPAPANRCSVAGTRTDAYLLWKPHDFSTDQHPASKTQQASTIPYTHRQTPQAGNGQRNQGIDSQKQSGQDKTDD